MSDSEKDIVPEMRKANMELKKKLEVISKMRVECAQMQLELLKLYTPDCLDILESLKQVMESPYVSNNEPSTKDIQR